MISDFKSFGSLKRAFENKKIYFFEGIIRVIDIRRKSMLKQNLEPELSKDRVIWPELSNQQSSEYVKNYL